MENPFQNIRRYLSGMPLIVLLIVAFVLGFLIRGGEKAEHPRESGKEASARQSQVQEWTCSMHPQIRQPKSGKCPICGMDLIPVTTGRADESLGPRQIKLSAAARELAEIQVAPVERKPVPHEVRMVGKIDYDETRLAFITAWVPGRLDRLYADYTGFRVNKGDPMVQLYSPELYAAQEELLQALEGKRKFESSPVSSIRNTAGLTVEAAREKLRLWGLSDKQVEEIIERGTPSTHITIRAPQGGTVIHKDAFEGMYVTTGTRIYSIADLSRLWVQLDAYESDLPWLNLGQEVEFTTESFPGVLFKGRIAFIDPQVNSRTRTVRVRLEVANPDRQLKPEMFVHAVVQARTEEAGEAGLPLVIPASAPLITGRRAVVYVEVPGREGVYEGREVILGSRAGEYYIVREGLSEGELVVVNGNFKLDSAIQILARQSMMSPEGGGPPLGHENHDMSSMQGPAKTEHQRGETPGEPGQTKVPELFKSQLQKVYTAYFKTQQALAADNLKGAAAGSAEILAALESVDMTLLDGTAHTQWMKYLQSLTESTDNLGKAQDIESARAAFDRLSQGIQALVGLFGGSGPRPIVLFHCPMAFNRRGAVWLQDHGDTENPYFGAAMLKCQDRIDTLYQVTAKDPREGGRNE